jgi:hypothetical protein
MLRIARTVAATLCLLLARGTFEPAGAQNRLWANLERGAHAVGLRLIDTTDVTRSFPDGRGGVRARPVRLYVWYPARAATGTALTLRTLAAINAPARSVLNPADPDAFARVLLRVRAGPAFARLPDAAADALLDMTMVARRNATAEPGRFPVVLLAPASPIALSITPEYLASHGFVVIGVDRTGSRSFESLAFTPNAANLDDEAANLAFSLGVARGMRNVDAPRLGLIGYSSDALANLAFAFRSRAPKAIVAFEGWEGWRAGQSFVRALPDYDPRTFRSAYLLVEKTAQEAQADLAKTHEFFDSMVYAPRWRIAFDDAIHTDFASFGVALVAPGDPLRRNFTAANETILAFLERSLGGDVARWHPRVTGPWMHVTSFVTQQAVLSNDEFFHLAETDPNAADTVAARLAMRSPPVVPFTESSLSRLALIASGRNPAAAATLYAIVARAFPTSTSAAIGLSDALATAGRTAEAGQAAIRALDLIQRDTTMSESAKETVRRRLSLRHPEERKR